MSIFLQRKFAIIFSIHLLYTLSTLSMESFFPLSFYGYTTKAPHPAIIDKENNTIITKSEKHLKDAFLHVLNSILKSEIDNDNVRGRIGSIYRDFDTNQSIEFVGLINSLAAKTQHDSEKVLVFIDEQRKIYQNIHNKTQAFFKAFDDAKIVFFYLPPIQEKIFNEKPITQDEGTYIINNYHLVQHLEVFKKKNQYTIVKPFSERFHEAAMLNSCYNHTLVNLAITEFFASVGVPRIFMLPMSGFAIGIIIGGTVAGSFFVPQIRQETIPVKEKHDDVFSIEDMDFVIQYTPFV